MWRALSRSPSEKQLDPEMFESVFWGISLKEDGVGETLVVGSVP